MTKKNLITLTVTLLAVVGFYFYLFKDSFHRPTIQISYTIRPSGAALFRGPASAGALENVTFGLTHDYKLTSIKVFTAAEIETNKFAHPLWDLVSESNSAPIRVFSYGMRIHGMHPSVKGDAPADLEPNVQYRLTVEAGSLKGERNFIIPEGTPLRQ